MMTVPQVWQLRQITDCCPGIGPQGEGVQGTHMKEVVEGGRKKVSVCIGRRGVEEAWSVWELLGVKMGRSPVEVSTLMLPSSSFSMSNKSAFTSSMSAFTILACLLLSKGGGRLLLQQQRLFPLRLPGLASASLRVSRRDLGSCFFFVSICWKASSLLILLAFPPLLLLLGVWVQASDTLSGSFSSSSSMSTTASSSSLTNFCLSSSTHERYSLLSFSLVIARRGGGTSQSSSDKKSFPQYFQYSLSS